MENDIHTNYPSTTSPLSVGVLPCTDTGEADALGGAMEYWLKEQNRNKWVFAIQWFSNALFFTGNHFSMIRWRPGGAISDAGEISIEPLAGMYNKYDKLINRQVDNKCKKAYETPVGILTKSNPMPRCTPNSGTPADKKAAKLSEIAFQVLWESTLHMPQKIREVAGQMILFGTSIVEIEYRETDIPIEIPRTRVEEYDDPIQEDLFDGEKPVRAVEDGFDIEYKRSMQADVWSPFNIIVDPASNTDPDSMNWIARQSFIDIGQLREEMQQRAETAGDDEFYYTDNLERVGPQDEYRQNSLYWYDQLKDILDSPDALRAYILDYGGVGSRDTRYFNETTKTVIDIKPNRHYPRGRTIIMGGNSLLYCGPARAWSAKYPERWHPYTVFRWWKAPNRFWGIPLFADIVPLQMRINKIDSLMRINQMFMAFGIWLWPKGSEIEKDTVSNHPGINRFYMPIGNQKPEKVKNEPLPGEILIERNLMVKAIDELAMVSRLMEGDNVSHLRAGTIIQAMQNEMVSSRSAVLMDFQDSIQGLAQNILIELNINLEDEDPALTAKMAAAAEDYSELMLKNFTGADLRDNIDIQIDIISAILTTPEAEAQKALDYVQAVQGQITPAERSKILEKLGMEDMENPDTSQVDRVEAMIENVINGDLDYATPDPELDDPHIFADRLKAELRKEKSYDLPEEVFAKLYTIMQGYAEEAKRLDEISFQNQLALAEAGLMK